MYITFLFFFFQSFIAYRPSLNNLKRKTFHVFAAQNISIFNFYCYKNTLKLKNNANHRAAKDY